MIRFQSEPLKENVSHSVLYSSVSMTSKCSLGGNGYTITGNDILLFPAKSSNKFVLKISACFWLDVQSFASEDDSTSRL
jgi:hypothetical protein